jgi:hypothetical protein
LCRKSKPFLGGDFKSVISTAKTNDSHGLHVHGRIPADFLVRHGSELVRFDSVSCQKSMCLLHDGISWLIIVKDHDASLRPAQDKRRI